MRKSCSLGLKETQTRWIEEENSNSNDILREPVQVDFKLWRNHRVEPFHAVEVVLRDNVCAKSKASSEVRKRLTTCEDKMLSFATITAILIQYVTVRLA